jgi:hypothetical protein
MRDIQVVCLFTTGRSGTAYLAQVFGGQQWYKRGLYHVDLPGHAALVTHERWAELPIPALKQLPMYAPDAIAIQRQYIQDRVCADTVDDAQVQKYFVTDHRIGRYFAPCMSTFSTPGKIIYVKRNEADVVASYLSRMEQRSKLVDAESYAQFQHDVWHRACYTPDEPDTVHAVSAEKWEAWSLECKLRWYWFEVQARWQRVKALADPADILEVDYETLAESGLDQIAAFTGIPYSKDLVDVRVNVRQLS